MIGAVGEEVRGSSPGGIAFREFLGPWPEPVEFKVRHLEHVDCGSYVREKISYADVDSRRIGFIGHSYGGRMALWAPAFDTRITASVSHCGSIPFRYSYTHDTGLQAEQVLPGFAAVHDPGGCDHPVQRLRIVAHLGGHCRPVEPRC